MLGQREEILTGTIIANHFLADFTLVAGLDRVQGIVHP